MKSLKKNFIYNMMFELLKLLIPFLTIPYVSRTIGADGVGIYSFTYSIVYYYVILARFGTEMYARREIAGCRDDLAARSRVFWEVFLFRALTSLVCIALYSLQVVFFLKEHRQIYWILILALLENMADISWFYQGLEEFGFIVRRNVIIKLCGLAYIFLIVKTRDDLALYVLGVVGWQFLGSLLLWLRIPRDVMRIPGKELHVFRHMRGYISLFLPSIAVNVYTVLDKTMIGLFCEGAFENGYYEQAYKTANILITVATALGAVINPRVTYHFVRKETERIRELMHKSYQVEWMISIPLCFGLIAVSDIFVPWFYGPGFEPVCTLLKISAFIIVAVGISNMTGIQYMVAIQRQKEYTISIVVGAVVNFLLNLIMIPLFQATGAIITSVISEFAVTGVQLYLVRKDLDVAGILRSGWKYWAAAVVMLVAVLMETRYMPATLPATACCAVSGALVYGGMLFLLRDRILREYTGKVYCRIRGK